MTTTAARQELLGGVASFGLPGRPLAPLCEDPLDGETWAALQRRCRHQKLQGLLLATIESGALPVTDAQRDEARARHLQACTEVLRLERRLLEVAQVLDEACIEHVVLKGSALAHLDYPDPAWRIFGDVDVLVRSDSLAASVAALGTHLGAVREVPELRPGYDRRFAKSVTLRCPDGVELDLHRHLLFGTFGFAVDLDELFRSSVPFPLGGETLRALGSETRLLHACYHAGLGDRKPRYSGVRDIAQLLLSDAHDPVRALELAIRWESMAVLQRGVRLCRELLGVDVFGPIPEAVDRFIPSRRDLRAIASYVGTNRSHTAKVLASVPFIRGVGDRAAFVLGGALPSRTFIEHQRAGLAGWLQKGWRARARRSG